MRAVFCLICVGLMAWVLSGCSGGGAANSLQTSEGGRASFSITWPEQSKVIPQAAESIVITLTGSEEFSVSQTVNRPEEGNTSTVQFTELPVEELTVDVVAYPEADAQGVALATGSNTLTVVADDVVEVTVNLTSTIDILTVTPADQTINIDDTLQLSAAAKDSNGDMVVLTPAKLTWESSDATVVSISDSGLATALKDGTVTITLTDTESSKTATTQITVRKRPTISLTLDNDSMLFGASTMLHWSTTDADTVTNSSFGTNALNGELAVNPTVSTTYTLSVSGPGGTAEASVTLTVATVSVAIDPSPVTMSVGKSKTFTASVTGATNDAVNWTLEGENSGTFTATGNSCTYKAPATRGTYHLKATSVADPTKSATVTITVQSGDATVTIQ